MVEEAQMGLSPRAFRFKQGAAVLSMSERHLRDLCRDGLIKTVHVGRTVLIPASEIDRFLVEQLGKRLPGRTGR